jgi:hypothetical protein
MALDSQQVELIGRNLLIAQLVADGLEVAVPARDRGVDLIVYSDREDHERFVAKPIQLKAASSQAFSLDQKYAGVAELLLVYVWNVANPTNAVTMCLTYHEALDVATEMGWTTTASWKSGKYSNNSPGVRLRKLLAPFEMQPGTWRRRIGLPTPF